MRIIEYVWEERPEVYASPISSQRKYIARKSGSPHVEFLNSSCLSQKSLFIPLRLPIGRVTLMDPSPEIGLVLFQIAQINLVSKSARLFRHIRSFNVQPPVCTITHALFLSQHESESVVHGMRERWYTLPSRGQNA